jgi:hypothetical protein
VARKKLLKSTNSVKRIAFFVEGGTELLFIDQLVREIAGESNVRIEKVEIRGGKSCAVRIQQLEAVNQDDGQKFYVLIVDCGGDESVASRIRERYQSLVLNGYTEIIGLRDLHPLERTELEKLNSGLKKYIPSKPIQVLFVVAVMEVEAWFIAEHTHFSKIDKRITAAAIMNDFGIDVVNDDASLILKPADKIKEIYAIGNKQYGKPAANTIKKIDFDKLALELPKKYPPLKLLADKLFEFFA